MSAPNADCPATDQDLLLHAIALPGWGTSPERLRPLCTMLADHGVDARPWSYEPTGSVRSLGASLARATAELGGEVHLVGHSLGGLIAASAVLHHGAPVASVTTINAPWRGTWAAWTAHPTDPLGRELRWRSDSLQQLRDALAHHLGNRAGPRWSVLSAAGDLAAPPTGALRVPGGPRLTAQMVRVTGHSVSLLHERMIEAVTDHVVGVAA